MKTFKLHRKINRFTPYHYCQLNQINTHSLDGSIGEQETIL